MRSLLLERIPEGAHLDHQSGYSCEATLENLLRRGASLPWGNVCGAATTKWRRQGERVFSKFIPIESTKPGRVGGRLPGQIDEGSQDWLVDL